MGLPELRAALELPADAPDAEIRMAVLDLIGHGYRTIEDVELVAVGMEWPAATGPVTVTFENLVDMMVAANDDPLIRAPRVKLGHERWQFTPDGVTELGDFDPAWSGEPCFGTATRLRINDDGNRLIGDLIEVPDWMALALPSAWPNRSCEWSLGQFNVETEGNRRYSAVLTAVALLGVQQQAVKNLRDVTRLVVAGPDDT